MAARPLPPPEPLRQREAQSQEAIDTRIGKLTFESGYPSQQTVNKLYDEMDFQRACQAYLWGLPAVGLMEWGLALRNIFKAKNGELVAYLDFKEKLGILTPNFTTPYICTVIDIEESGPIVVEFPSGLMAGMIHSSSTATVRWISGSALKHRRAPRATGWIRALPKGSFFGFGPTARRQRSLTRVGRCRILSR